MIRTLKPYGTMGHEERMEPTIEMSEQRPHEVQKDSPETDNKCRCSSHETHNTTTRMVLEFHQTHGLRPPGSYYALLVHHISPRHRLVMMMAAYHLCLHQMSAVREPANGAAFSAADGMMSECPIYLIVHPVMLRIIIRSSSAISHPGFPTASGWMVQCASSSPQPILFEIQEGIMRMLLQ